MLTVVHMRRADDSKTLEVTVPRETWKTTKISYWQLEGSGHAMGRLMNSFFFLLLFNLYFTICPAGHLVNFSNLIAK